jgi:hypothetical protein
MGEEEEKKCHRWASSDVKSGLKCCAMQPLIKPYIIIYYYTTV